LPSHSPARLRPRAENTPSSREAAQEQSYHEREATLGPELFHRLERWIMLGLEWDGGGFRGINQLWREHLLNMDHLKEGIGLRG
jgi:preprotein translocase subunit SecA